MNNDGDDIGSVLRKSIIITTQQYRNIQQPIAENGLTVCETERMFLFRVDCSGERCVFSVILSDALNHQPMNASEELST